MKAVTFIDYADKGQQMQRLTENTAGNRVDGSARTN